MIYLFKIICIEKYCNLIFIISIIISLSLSSFTSPSPYLHSPLLAYAPLPHLTPPVLPSTSQVDMQRVVDSAPVEQYVDSTFGYVSLFPLLMKLLPADSDKLPHLLGDLRRSDLLWTVCENLHAYMTMYITHVRRHIYIYTTYM